MANEQEAPKLDEYGFELPVEGTKVKHMIGVVSGKGGVGKTLVTSLMACAAQRLGNTVGIFDGDITGPSIPKSFGLRGPVRANPMGILPVQTDSGIQVMSTNFLLPNEDDPVVWRGPVIAGVIQQFWNEVVWGELDYMFIDMPPGTGDVPLTVFQTLPLDGIVIVTSPQELVSMIVRKAVKMANDMGVPVFGIVENYSYFECPDCGKQHKIFGDSHVDEVADKYGIQLVAKLPIDPSVAEAVDAGKIETLDSPVMEQFVQAIGEMVDSLPHRKSPFLIAQERQAAELDARLDEAGIPRVDQQ